MVGASCNLSERRLPLHGVDGLSLGAWERLRGGWRNIDGVSRRSNDTGIDTSCGAPSSQSRSIRAVDCTGFHVRFVG